jgi:UDP-N-acetylglucosamine--N-acetylmuramyl-(pentapeptide) pyrophosphoryl-undecaprenol N-acetylglucosamine transferase
LAFPIDGRNGSRYRVTGRPIPPPYEDRAEARRRLGVAAGETCVLVFGGSLGARSINLAALDAYAGAAFHVVHVCGRRDHPELSARPLPQGYDLREYMDLGEFAQALAAADLVVARAGGSLFEVAAHGKPAILIPYPHATADHQAANARWMERGGAAVVVPDGELSAARLARETAALLADPQRLRAMAAAARRLARPDAADAVADELLQAARG